MSIQSFIARLVNGPVLPIARLNFTRVGCPRKDRESPVKRMPNRTSVGALPTQTTTSRLRTGGSWVQFLPGALSSTNQFPGVAQCRGNELRPRPVRVQVLPPGPWNVNWTSAQGFFAKEIVPHRAGWGACPPRSAIFNQVA